MYTGFPCPKWKVTVSIIPELLLEKFAIVTGNNKIELANIGGITPEVLSLSGI